MTFSDWNHNVNYMNNRFDEVREKVEDASRNGVACFLITVRIILPIFPPSSHSQVVFSFLKTFRR